MALRFGLAAVLWLLWVVQMWHRKAMDAMLDDRHDIIWQRQLRQPPAFPASLDPPEHCSLTLGPIVGLVTDTTARIMLEADRQENITVVLRPRDQGQASVLGPRLVAGHHPTVFQFTELLPETAYDIEVVRCNLPRHLNDYFSEVQSWRALAELPGACTERWVRPDQCAGQGWTSTPRRI